MIKHRDDPVKKEVIMATNWKKTLWDIILTILSLGISHIQKRKKKLEEESKKSTNTPSEN
ncbi:MAG TPA: hypothetical protein DD657_00535 [Culturomica sp.]|nr:hypothetical protein [Culturomica sp.]